MYWKQWTNVVIFCTKITRKMYEKTKNYMSCSHIPEIHFPLGGKIWVVTGESENIYGFEIEYEEIHLVVGEYVCDNNDKLLVKAKT